MSNNRVELFQLRAGRPAALTSVVRPHRPPFSASFVIQTAAGGVIMHVINSGRPSPLNTV